MGEVRGKMVRAGTKVSLRARVRARVRVEYAADPGAG